MVADETLATDDDLMAALAQGDEFAGELLLRRHGPTLLGFLVRLLGNYHDAQEIFQDAFVRLLEKKDVYKAAGTFRGYLFKIARNLAMDLLRHRGVRKEISVEGAGDDDGSFRDVVRITKETPLELLERREFVRVIEQSVEELPETLKDAFLLKRYGDLDYEQVAATLDISVSAAKMRVSRALDFIETAVGAYMDEGASKYRMRKREKAD